MKVDLPEFSREQMNLLDTLPLSVVFMLLRRGFIGGVKSYVQNGDKLYVAFTERGMLRIECWQLTESPKRHQRTWRYRGWVNTLRDMNQFRTMYMR